VQFNSVGSQEENGGMATNLVVPRELKYKFTENNKMKKRSKPVLLKFTKFQSFSKATKDRELEVSVKFGVIGLDGLVCRILV
jgi:hypothetical protein